MATGETSMKTEIAQLISELYDGKFKKDFTEEDILRILDQDNVYAFFYREDEKIVAMTVLYVVELFTRKLGVIEEVVTLDDYRNRGIGSSLIRRAIKKAKALGLTCLELNVREDRPEVQKFYEKMGFYDRKNKAMRLWINKG